MTAVVATAGAAAATPARPADTTAPTAPTFASTDYPISGPTTVIFGGSGTVTLTATDPGPQASGVYGFLYQIDGSGTLAANAPANLRAKGGKATLSIPLSWLRAGTNTVVAQTIDVAGLRSAVTSYSFFIAGSVFPPPVAGDVDGDGIADLVTVDAAGNVRLFSKPGVTTVNPTGNTVNDPLQYGGIVMIGANQNARAAAPDSASAAGALVTHSGSSSDRSDALLVLQHGFLAVAGRQGPPTQWSFSTSNVTKPACSTCANYNRQNWSSVTQLTAVKTTAAAGPNLLTVEVVNDTATVLWYPAGIIGTSFRSPIVVSTSTAGWNWSNLQIIGAGPLPGSAGVSLWVRNPDTGQLYLMHDITSGIADPATAAIAVGTGFTTAAYPLLTTVGQPGANGDLTLWGTTPTGRLAVIPTNTTAAGVTTIGPRSTISREGWASHELALGSSYSLYNNSGVAVTGTSNQAFDTATTNSFAYNADALGVASLSPDAIVNDGGGGCPTGWTACVPGLGSSTLVALPNDQGAYDIFTLPAPWAHQRDNYVAAGQLVPVPVPGTSGSAHGVRFLGAAATTDTLNGASVAATVTYTNGDTQAITITLADWTQDLTTSPVAGNTTVATMDHRTVATTGADDPTATHLFATAATTLLDNGAPLAPSVQIASIRLGTNSAVHIFAIALS